MKALGRTVSVSKAPNSSAELAKIASDWIARRNGGLSVREAEELQAWLDANQEHAATFAAMEHTWALLNEPRRTGQSTTVWHEMERREQHRARRRQTYGIVLTGLAAAASLAFVFLQPYRPPSVTKIVPLTVIRPDVKNLPDGSRVELNAGAEISMAFSATRRGVLLLRGEALFTVAKDPARPFVVSAAGVDVRAVGTAFVVRCQPKAVEILVTEGHVAVERVADVEPVNAADGTSEASIQIGAGNLISVPSDLPGPGEWKVRSISAAEITAALAWRGKRIEFGDTKLPVALQLFNRQNQVQMVTDDPSLAGRSITGIFWVDDPEGFARLLESGLNLSTERTGDTIILRSR